MSLLNEAKRLLLRPRNVVLLLTFITCSIVVGAFIPQKVFRGEAYFETLHETNPLFAKTIAFLQLDQIYTSAWFLALIGLLWLALCLTTWDQLRSLLKKSKDQPDHRPLSFYLAKSGVFLFHLSLVVVVTAALYGLSFFQWGEVQIIEGETFEAKQENWTRTNHGNFAEQFDPGFFLALASFKVDYWQNDDEKSLKSKLMLAQTANEQTAPVQLSLSKPIQYNDVTLYQGNDFGYSLTFVLSFQDKRPVATHFLLNATGNKYRPVTGKNDFPETPFVFNMSFWPDTSKPSFFIEKPVVDLQVSNSNQVLFDGRMNLGDSVPLTKEITLHFFDTRYWTRIIAARSYGIPLLYTGFLLATIGLVLMYWPYPEKYESKQ